MIVEERLTTYLHSLESADIPVLDEIEQEALADMVPIIRKETKSFLKVMLEIKRPVKILEIGTAVGFSAILMGKYSPDNPEELANYILDKVLELAAGKAGDDMTVLVAGIWKMCYSR